MAALLQQGGGKDWRGKERGKKGAGKWDHKKKKLSLDGGIDENSTKENRN